MLEFQRLPKEFQRLPKLLRSFLEISLSIIFTSVRSELTLPTPSSRCEFPPQLSNWGQKLATLDLAPGPGKYDDHHVDVDIDDVDGDADC